MARRAKTHPWANHPELLTSLRSPWDKFRKADWNFSRYEDAVFARPCDPEAVTYTALDYCIAVVSLRDWTNRHVLREARTNGFPLPNGLDSPDDFLEFVREQIPWQAAIEAIANTTKHAEYRDKGWLNGTAMVASFFPENVKADQDACSDGVELFKLIHQHSNVAWWDIALRQSEDEAPLATPGYVAFGDALDAWKTLLVELNLEET